MCSVIGYAPMGDQTVEQQAQAKIAFGHLFEQSRIRGHHAYGIALEGAGDLTGSFDLPNMQHKVIDGGIELLRTFNSDGPPRLFDPTRRSVTHCRYSTSGDWKNLSNSQPLIAHGMALAFNGVIHMGTKEEFEHAFDVQCQADNDGEIFLQMIHKGENPSEFVAHIQGSFAGVWLQNGRLHAVRNSRRPLWFARNHGALWFASTLDIFVRAGFMSATELPAIEQVIQ